MFDHPDGILCLERTLIVADTYNHTLRVVDKEGGYVSTLAGCGKAGHVDGSFYEAQFNFP